MNCGIKRKKMADGGLVTGEERKRRLDSAIDGATPARSVPRPTPGAAMQAVAPIASREPVFVPPPTDGVEMGIQQMQMQQQGVIGPDTRRARQGRMRFMARGGKVVGPGGPRDDKVPAMLSNGEYVLPADTVEKVGVQNLERLRAATHTGVARRTASIPKTKR